ncbi:DEAD-box ATP-dependent RNA helicase 21 [Galdieria sulphuraria]|nr:DEAD-box ATP-dependent RNA helicase 21 [Galdieria sulphuraria]
MFQSAKDEKSRRHISPKHSRRRERSVSSRRDSTVYSKRSRKHFRSELVEETTSRKTKADYIETLDSPQSGGNLEHSSSSFPYKSQSLGKQVFSNDTQLKKTKREPISLEDIMKKKREEEEEAQKPRFISKSERERQALEKLYERRKAVDPMKVESTQFHSNSLSKGIPRPPVDVQRERNQKQSDTSRENDEESHRLKELLRKHYMKEKDTKSRLTKPSERFRFRFEWDNSEDTLNTEEYAELSSFVEVPLLFGRGHRGGMDPASTPSKAPSKRVTRPKVSDMEGVPDSRLDMTLEDPVHHRHKKDMRHWSEKPKEEMTERDWRIFREDHSIAYRGGKAPFPARNWEETGLPRVLLDSVRYIAKYKQPTPIQMAAIPIGLAKRDMIGLAETGSGKTAAFVLPMLVYISQRPPMTAANAAQGPYAVILAPTRELAQQIEEETRKFAEPLGYRVCSVVGGVSIEEQGMKLREGVEIVIATPGRMIDCLERRYCVLNQCDYVVLDEADRMIDMGFEPQVQGVLDAMPSSHLKPEVEELSEEFMEESSSILYRQTFMFSATMPPAVERLARKFLRNPIIVAVGDIGKGAELVQQRVEYVPNETKKKLRFFEVVGYADPPILVFLNTKRDIRATVIHSGKPQELREEHLEGFKQGKYDILIATDVLGRGIDIKGVNLVINYEMPNKIENYTHRIGRTGRAGREGLAISFVTPADSEIFYDLKLQLEKVGAKVPPEIANHESVKSKSQGFGIIRD